MATQIQFYRNKKFHIEDKRKKRAVPEFDVAYYNRLLEEEKMELKLKLKIMQAKCI